MDQAQIIKWTRRGIREPKTDRITDPEIVLMTLEGVNYLGMKIKNIDPSYYLTRKAVQSSTFVFDKPSDCMAIVYVWDLGTTATTISGAADNGSGEVRITTSAAHGFSDGDLLAVQGVGGTTEANGAWVIDYDDSTMADTVFDLTGSTFTNTYSSGGLCYAPPENPQRIYRLNLDKSALTNDRRWYPQGDKIIIDQKDFENDILVDYVRSLTSITDIPEEYHMGLVAWNIANLLSVPPRDQSNIVEYQDKVDAWKRNNATLQLIEERIAETFRVAHEPLEIIDEDPYDAEMES